MIDRLYNTLHEAVDKNIFVDITTGAEKLGVTRERFNAAVLLLNTEGYPVRHLILDEEGSDKKVKIRVLCAPGISQEVLYTNRDKIVELAA